MNAIAQLFQRNPLLRVALIVPSALLFIFSFFNLSTVVDPARTAAAITLGVVDLDRGQGPIRVGDRLIPGLEANLPFKVQRFADEATARAALDNGKVTALMILPEDFTVQAIGDGPKSIKVVTTQHLSAAESQFGAGLPAQLSSGISTAIAMAKAQMGGGAPPVVVTAEPEVLHAAPSNAALAVPIVLGFAMWLAAFVGSLTLYLGSRTAGRPAEVALLRTLFPIVSTGLATLVLATTVAWLANMWGVFLPLWGIALVALYAMLLLIEGLFALFGMVAILLVVPVVFLQSSVAGLQTPLAAAPDWLRWLGEALPFGELPRAFRSLLIGGPFGPFWADALATALIGVALIWIGGYARGMLTPRGGSDRLPQKEVHAA